jgi:hypothetical protein
MTAALLASVTMLPHSAHAAAFTIDQLFANAIATNNNNVPGCTSEAKSSAPVTSAQQAVALTLTSSGNCTPLDLSATSIATAVSGPTVLRAASRATTTSPGASVQAFASARARLEDTFTVTGAGTFLFSASFTGSVSACAPTTGLQYSLALTAGNGAALGSFGGGCVPGPISNGMNQTLTLGLGQIVRLQALISTMAEFRDGTGTNFADAGNSLHMHLTPTSQGASYITESGANYAAPAVPEPGAAVLVFAGFAALAVRRGRRMLGRAR